MSQAESVEWSAVSSCGSLPCPGTEAVSPAWQTDALPLRSPRWFISFGCYNATVNICGDDIFKQLIICLSVGALRVERRGLQQPLPGQL